MNSQTDTNIYAIIKSGGKQYRVAQNDIIEVELLDAELGAQVDFADILFISDDSKANVGGPSVAGYFVRGELLDVVPGKKITSVKYKPSHHQYRKFGHRQHYSRIKITEIAKERKQETKKHGT